MEGLVSSRVPPSLTQGSLRIGIGVGELVAVITSSKDAMLKSCVILWFQKNW